MPFYESVKETQQQKNDQLYPLHIFISHTAYGKGMNGVLVYTISQSSICINFSHYGPACVIRCFMFGTAYRSSHSLKYSIIL